MSPQSRRGRPLYRPSLSFVLLIGLFTVLWFAGGASRADTMGQVVVRTVAWFMLAILALAGSRPVLDDVRPVLAFMLTMLVLVLVQLVPLPPAIWQVLPGRAIFVGAVEGVQPWRPWAIVPGATWNAASSLVVPFVTLLVFSGLSRREHSWVPGLLLLTVTAAMILGLMQFSGARFLNPLINATLGQVSGNFANRNHFSLFLSMGCLLAPVWAFASAVGARWRAPVALALVMLFMLTILATGSRAGLVTGSLALGGGIAFSWHPLRLMLRRGPRWLFPTLVIAVLGLAITLVVTSIWVDRASSIHRAVVGEEGEDMRTRGLPTVMAMISTYFPIGSGFGGFDPIFRLHEPFALLKPTYFNHAHNDFLEIALDGGVAGMLLLAAALGWWVFASIRVWRLPWITEHLLARVGSAMLGLVLVASVFDYPARTPMMMAIIVIAAIWLAQAGKLTSRFALPTEKQHL